MQYPCILFSSKVLPEQAICISVDHDTSEASFFCSDVSDTRENLTKIVSIVKKELQFKYPFYKITDTGSIDHFLSKWISTAIGTRPKGKEGAGIDRSTCTYLFYSKYGSVGLI